MIRNLLLCFVFILLLSSCRESDSNFETIVPSPDAKTHLYFNLNNGEPYYLIYINNNILVDWSMMGFIVDDTINFYEGLVVKSKETYTGQEKIENVLSDYNDQLGRYNEISIHLGKGNTNDIHMSVVFRVYDNKVAYKYFLNGLTAKGSVKEITELDLYRGVFHKVILQDFSQTKLFDIDSVKLLNLPATFISDEGFKLVYLQSVAEGGSRVKLNKRVPEKSEYLLEQEKIQTDASNYESLWRIIYISNNLN